MSDYARYMRRFVGGGQPGAVAAPGNPNQGAPIPMTRYGDTIGSVNSTAAPVNVPIQPETWTPRHRNVPIRPETWTPARIPAPPSPGLGMGVPAPVTYEDNSYGYEGRATDPLLMLLTMLLNQRFPNNQ